MHKDIDKKKSQNRQQPSDQYHNNLSDVVPLIVFICVLFAVKMLLIPAYRSTDFDVHQNWLRITYNQPISKWYFDQKSKWTLDYPPMFAYFEYFLSQIAVFFDPSIVQIALESQLSATIYFQRMSVIFSQLIYIMVLWKILGFTEYFVVAALSIPFLLLDNIHFQYNIMMQGLLILSVHFIKNHRFLMGSFFFSLLLNFKHIYLYAAPVFFVYILKWYVFNNIKSQQKWTIKLLKVGTVTIIPFIISFAPFILIGDLSQLSQIFRRLFPFQRGLVHQYWAPNFWSLYLLADKVIFQLFSKYLLSAKIIVNEVASSPSSLKILPTPDPIFTLLIIGILMLPVVYHIWRNDKHNHFPKMVAISGLIFFMFGFHVHQKAITPYLSILFVFASQSTPHLNAIIFVNIVNLFPLLIEPKQTALKIVLLMIWLNYCRTAIDKKIKVNKKDIIIRIFANSYFEQTIYLSGIFVVIVGEFVTIKRFQFLPLMLNSVWAAIINLYWGFLIYQKILTSKKQQQYQQIAETDSDIQQSVQKFPNKK